MAAEPGADRLWGRPAQAAWARLLHGLAPLLIAVPVAIVIATMVARALDVSHPDLGFATTVNSDAEAFYLGETIYQDPADGYTGQLYTPLFPFLVSLLHRIDLWGGWPLLVNYAATFVLIEPRRLARVRPGGHRGAGASSRWSARSGWGCSRGGW